MNKLQWNLRRNSFIFILENVVCEMASIWSRPQWVKQWVPGVHWEVWWAGICLDGNPWAIRCCILHDDVIKWKRSPRNWPFVRGIHRSPVNYPHKGQWRGALMFSLIWLNGWVNNDETGDLRRYRAHSDVTVMDRHVNDWYPEYPSRK